MKINGYGPQSVYSAYSRDGKAAGEQAAAKPAGRKDSADRVEISPEAARRSEAQKLAGAGTREDDAQRAARVAAIRRQVQDGTYHVSADTVARSLLGGRVDTQA